MKHEDNNPVVREIAKLSVKIDTLCQEVRDLKKFHYDAIEIISRLDERVRNLESWRCEVERENTLKQQFKYDLRSAVAGGLAGSGITVIMFMFRVFGFF